MELNVAEKSTKSVVILAAPALWKSPWLFLFDKDRKETHIFIRGGEKRSDKKMNWSQNALNGRLSPCEKLIELLRAVSNKRATDAWRLISPEGRKF